MDLFNKCEIYYKKVEEAINQGYYPYFKPISSEASNWVTINGERYLMLGSNNYLGLTNDPRVKEAAIKAVEKYGTGCTGSRFLNGTLDLHLELEEKLAKFFNKNDCIVFSTGYQTNLGIISSLVGKNDYVITDKLDHASIIDGCKLSSGTVKRFPHNNMASLERILKSLPKNSGKLIVVDGVFSMEGDVCNLPEIISLKEKYGARVLLDEAHAIGVLGENGRGTAEHFGLEDKVDLIMGTFSKSFATIGGFVVGEKKVIAYIRHNARSLIFSASLPPASLGAALKVLEIIQTEPERRKNLWKITEKMRKGLKELDYDIGNSVTPIIPIIIGEDMKTLKFWQNLFKNKIFTNPVIPPAVPPNRSLIRTSYMATHTEEDIDFALEVFKKLRPLL
ncbi:MAG: pyridoxal phosphate-dependent aminotransferase family protein [candidate division WOR-3 bacterium]|nr:pyridoxal phosphate-dependent aminotransferase family protein [candidate division WOR-3 bacterium]MCX7837024.1 pyridoxal phosphate-dependent aminotransferase family protein [candidate division WOR-3 bacterium]MDW8114575.1 pyridoxal phosphate-dependent aminotransferase family protein [candidate division WOR-3 bacterium]